MCKSLINAFLKIFDCINRSQKPKKAHRAAIFHVKKAVYYISTYIICLSVKWGKIVTHYEMKALIAFIRFINLDLFS